MEMRKVAVPLSKGKLCAHFGHCEQFAIYQVSGNKIVSSEVVDPPAHQPGVFPLWLKKLDVDDVIAGGIGQRAIDLFMQNGINVYAGAQLKDSVELVQELVNGELQAGENLCDH